MTTVELNSHERTWARSERWLAAAVTIALPVNVPGITSISLGVVAGIVVTPVMLRDASKFTKYRRLLIFIVASCFSGLFLVAEHDNGLSGHSVDFSTLSNSYVLLLGFAAEVGCVIWAGARLGVSTTAFLYAIGALIAVGIGQAQLQDNPWKYALAFPTCLIVLCVVARGRMIFVYLSGITLVSTSLLFDTRNTAGAVVIAVIACTILGRSSAPIPWGRFCLFGALILTAIASIYSSINSAAADGDLGYKLQATVQAQASSDAAVAGRVEYGATFALLSKEPLGLGPGVIPSLGEIQIGKAGLAALGVGTNSEYVDDDMFANRFEVHSIAGDLWVLFGLGGLALAAYSASCLVQGVRSSVTLQSVSERAIVSYVSFQAGWDLLFSPFYANYRTFALSVGICIVTATQLGNRQEPPRGHRAK